MTSPGAEKLNDQQQAAVDHDDGPLLVLAGPGTGKTRVITRRISRLVDDGNAPETILAITFTTKAAGQMRSRLCDLIGVSAAERVHVSTIHGFGLRLVQRFADLAGLPHEPQIIDSAQRRRLMRDLLGDMRVEPAHAAQGWDSIIEFAQQWMAAFRNAALSPARVTEAIEQRDVALVANVDNLDELAIAGERAFLERLDLAARLYERFTLACRQRGWLTLDDLITIPIDLLDAQRRVRDIVHAELRHVVVDEFQDVNAAQIELLRRLAPPQRRPDLCVVGDDDQAIYMFRGADDRALAHFSAIWTGHATVRLTHNYRSDRTVIDVANAVITRAEERYAHDKTIVPALPAAPAAGVECVWLDQADHEPGAIATMLLEDRAANPQRDWHDYAVIGRTHRDLERIGEALRLEDIQFVPARESGALDDDGVKDVLAWMKVLTEPEDTSATLRLLSRPPLQAAPSDVMALLRRYQASDRTTPFCQWIEREGESMGAVNTFCAIRRDLEPMAVGVSADRAIWTIIERTDPAHADLLAPKWRFQRMQSLIAMVNFARDKTPRLGEPGDLTAFWSYYQDLDPTERAFEIVGRETVEGPEDEQERQHAGVQLLTTFGAKGLEFDTVFVPRVAPPHGYPRSRHDDPDEIPEWMAPLDPAPTSIKERRAAEERRIFYVACTRAKRRLVLISKRTKKRSTSIHFFQELAFDAPHLVTERDEQTIMGTRADVEVEAAALGLVDRSRSITERARRRARAEAAQALHQADDPDASPEILQAIDAQLTDAARRMGVAAALAAGQGLPAWLAQASPATRDWSVALEARVQRAAHDDDSMEFTPLKPPLTLSYTKIRAYADCPMCYYIHHVLGLRDPQTEHMLLGNAAHQTLEWFYEQHRDADAHGHARPTEAEVRRYARAKLVALAGADRAVSRALSEKLDAQLVLTLQKLDDPAADVLDLERHVEFAYAHAGVDHTMVARLDRVDRMADGGFRIIDYKTGRESLKLTEPPKDDLQMAIYAMALSHLYPAPDGEVPDGVAEYWVLSAGRRGVLRLSDLKLDKARQRIDDAIKGMLAGDFRRNDRCNGPCSLFAHELDPQPLLFPEV